MKKLLLILFLIISSVVFAQIDRASQINSTTICSTSSISKNQIYLDQIKLLDHTNDNYYIKIYIHILRKEQSPKYGQSVENVNRLMKVLYDDFDPLQIYFVWDGYIDYIDNTEFFNFPFYYTHPDYFPNNTSPIFNTNNHDDGVDIYLGDDLYNDETTSGFGVANGVGESSELYIGGYWAGEEVLPLSRLKVISHEMGHVFYLWHTHHGTFNEGGSGDECAELVNGDSINHSSCGDYISDTPADPNIYYNVNNDTCAYEYDPTNTIGIQEFDSNGDQYQPDTSNLMSYSIPTCLSGFTLEQKSRMKNSIWYLPHLHQTLLENYTYIRSESCFVCNENNENAIFIVTSSYDQQNIAATGSSNISIVRTPISNNSFFISATSLLENGPDDEGEPGYFYIHAAGDNGMKIAKQHIWVGLPKAVEEESLSGTEIVSNNEYFHYTIENRIEGIENYQWEFPEPWAFINKPSEATPNIWQPFAYGKYYRSLNGFAGNQTGYVKVRGVNPCGIGSTNDNRICVENESDPQGDTECDDDPPPILYYPNPSDSLLKIDLSLQNDKVYTVVIYDQTQTVKYSDQTNNILKTIAVFNLPNDTYYLHVYDDTNELILSNTLIINH